MLENRSANSNVFKTKRGIALLITLTVLVLLVAVIMEFHRKSFEAYRSAYTQQILGKLEAMVSSGVNFSILALQIDSKENDFESLHDKWAILSKDDTLKKLFLEGELTVNISDLSGRFPVNVFSQESSNLDEMKEIFVRLLTSGSFAIEDENEARQIVDAIKDWIDADDEESEYGAESKYYRSSSLTYDCKNGKIDSAQELGLIRGITEKLLYGTKDKKGLGQFLNFNSDDYKLNLNTAPKEMLLSLNPSITEELAEELIDFRNNSENISLLAESDWYKNIEGWPEDIALNSNFLTTKSVYYEIDITAIKDQFLKKLKAVVKRTDKNQIEFIWKVLE